MSAHSGHGMPQHGLLCSAEALVHAVVASAAQLSMYKNSHLHLACCQFLQMPLFLVPQYWSGMLFLWSSACVTHAGALSFSTPTSTICVAGCKV